MKIKWQEDEGLLRRFLELYFVGGLKSVDLFEVLEREFDLQLSRSYHNNKFAASIAWSIQSRAKTTHPSLYNEYFTNCLKPVRETREERRLRIPDNVKEFVEWLPSWIDSCDRRLKKYKESRKHQAH